LKYTLKKRQYLGTTSFDSELSLVTANHARVNIFLEGIRRGGRGGRERREREEGQEGVGEEGGREGTLAQPNSGLSQGRLFPWGYPGFFFPGLFFSRSFFFVLIWRFFSLRIFLVFFFLENFLRQILFSRE
jgi:hypothetical protein